MTLHKCSMPGFLGRAYCPIAFSMEMAVRASSGRVAGPFWPSQLLPGHLPPFGGEIRRRLRRPRHFGLRTCHEEQVRSQGSGRVAWGPHMITSLGGVAEAQPQPRGRLSSFGRDFGEKRPHGKAALQSGFARARALAWWQCWTVSSHKRHQDLVIASLLARTGSSHGLWNQI